MSEKVNCPFCGNIVESDAYRCSSCGSLFADPELPNIKFKEFGKFVALLVLTFGLFGIFWIVINYNAVNKLTVNSKDKIKFNTLIAISISDVIAYIVCFTFIILLLFFQEFFILINFFRHQYFNGKINNWLNDRTLW